MNSIPKDYPTHIFVKNKTTGVTVASYGLNKITNKIIEYVLMDTIPQCVTKVTITEEEAELHSPTTSVLHFENSPTTLEFEENVSDHATETEDVDMDVCITYEDEDRTENVIPCVDSHEIVGVYQKPFFYPMHDKDDYSYPAPAEEIYSISETCSPTEEQEVAKVSESSAEQDLLTSPAKATEDIANNSDSDESEPQKATRGRKKKATTTGKRGRPSKKK